MQFSHKMKGRLNNIRMHAIYPTFELNFFNNFSSAETMLHNFKTLRPNVDTKN